MFERDPGWEIGRNEDISWARKQEHMTAFMVGKAHQDLQLEQMRCKMLEQVSPTLNHSVWDAEPMWKLSD